MTMTMEDLKEIWAKRDNEPDNSIEVTMTQEGLAAASDEMARSEAAKHYGDRTHHWVVLADLTIAREFPEHQNPDDPDGPPCPPSRVVKEPCCNDSGYDLGREYHLPFGVDPYAARNVLMGIPHVAHAADWRRL